MRFLIILLHFYEIIIFKDSKNIKSLATETLFKMFRKIDWRRVWNYFSCTYFRVDCRWSISTDIGRQSRTNFYRFTETWHVTVCLSQVSQAYLVSEPDPADRKPALFFRFLLLHHLRVPCQRRYGKKGQKERRRKLRARHGRRRKKNRIFRFQETRFFGAIYKIRKYVIIN